MNSPTIPGQNNKGKKGEIVVNVPVNTGTNTSEAANLTASVIVNFLKLLNKRWAFSITTIASSTTIPKPNKNANNTMVFNVKSNPGMNKNVNKADKGTESPTNAASRTPIKNINTITTKINPRITVLIKSARSPRVRSDWSAVTETTKPAGKRLSRYSSIVFSMRSAALIRFAPLRLITFKVITDFLSKRAKSCFSSNPSRTSATSFKRTRAPVEEPTIKLAN